MMNAPRKLPCGEYEVGFGRPPAHSRFRRGVSGNPGGRPRRMIQSRRARNLVLREAYRMVTVREGDKVSKMPALQAVVRSHLTLAAKGNGPAQRALFAIVNALEQENAAQTDAPRNITFTWKSPSTNDAANSEPSSRPRTHENWLDELK